MGPAHLSVVYSFLDSRGFFGCSSHFGPWEYRAVLNIEVDEIHVDALLPSSQLLMALGRLQDREPTRVVNGVTFS